MKVVKYKRHAAMFRLTYGQTNSTIIFVLIPKSEAFHYLNNDIISFIKIYYLIKNQIILIKTQKHFGII